MLLEMNLDADACREGLKVTCIYTYGRRPGGSFKIPSPLMGEGQDGGDCLKTNAHSAGKYFPPGHLKQVLKQILRNPGQRIAFMIPDIVKGVSYPAYQVSTILLCQSVNELPDTYNSARQTTSFRTANHINLHSKPCYSERQTISICTANHVNLHGKPRHSERSEESKLHPINRLSGP